MVNQNDGLSVSVPSGSSRSFIPLRRFTDGRTLFCCRKTLRGCPTSFAAELQCRSRSTKRQLRLARMRYTQTAPLLKSHRLSLDSSEPFELLRPGTR